MLQCFCSMSMGTMFRSALRKDLIAKHPVDGVRYTEPAKLNKLRRPAMKTGAKRAQKKFRERQNALEIKGFWTGIG